ncbi:MAG: hypothetical protein C0507_07285 [Cyanobacteria bacterium PR.3.49]|nr:hypothetical protein [Cyanobacteria bacterium PR.3.49]
MLPATYETTNFDFSPVAVTAEQPSERDHEVTQYNLAPIEVRISHPLILDSQPMSKKACNMDESTAKLRALLKSMFPQDAQIRQLMLPLMQGQEMTERRRLELEACVKYPHVLDLQAAFVKRELGEGLDAFELELLRRMDAR